MPLYDLTEFLKLSSVLNYNLSAASLNRHNLLIFIIGNRTLHSSEKKDRELRFVLMEALSFIVRAYSQKRRRLGPLAVLHPIRATALLARSLEEIRTEDLLKALFHDILEDIQPLAFDPAEWREMEAQLFDIFGRLTVKKEADVQEALRALTKVEGESYYRYIGRLLKNSAQANELVLIKLADRLDNTLDMRIDIQDPLEGVNFFEHIFQILAVNSYPGYRPEIPQTSSKALNASRRLYQLFKNAVLLSLIRQHAGGRHSGERDNLFNAVCIASLREAQRTFLNIIHYHCKDTCRERALLLEAIEYCYRGRTDQVTLPNQTHLMDELFSTYFAFTSKQTRHRQLDILHHNKPLMIEASIAFITIFFSFLNDPGFFVKGISADGIAPV